MKKYILILFFCSCTDLILNNESQFHSIHLSGEAWVELNKSNEFNSDTFSIELWFSPYNSNESQTIVSIIDEYENVKFGLFIDPINPSSIQVRHENMPINQIELPGNLFNETFYYIAITSSDFTDIYINGYKNTTIEDRIYLENNSIMIGAKVNKEHTIIENYLFGYVDEARLWNTYLNETIILFHHLNPDKISQYSSDQILQNLHGLWKFNNSNNEYSAIIPDYTCQTIITTYIDYACTINNDAVIYTTGSGLVEFSNKGK